MKEYDEFVLWFSLVNLPQKIKLDIIKSCNSFEDIWNNLQKHKSSNIMQNNKIYGELKKANDCNAIKEIKAKLQKGNINYVTYYDKEYPQKLKNYEYSPGILFYKGDIERLNSHRNVAIVGARGNTYYGDSVCELISKELVLNDINIISGLAKGIDRMAHLTAIKNKGYTCGIMGSGIDILYPKSNYDIYNHMENEGCIISEFLPSTPPNSWNFPIRNRIISALSDLLIVIEAGEKSGSLITANLALEQGIDVMAVPGPVFSDKSLGTNKLIKDGAYIYTSIEDLYDILKIDRKNQLKLEKSTIDKKYSKIYNVLSDVPTHIDDIIKLTNIDIQHLYELLFEMQANCKIKCLAGNYYVKIS